MQNQGNAVCASVHCLGIGQNRASSSALLASSMADLKRHEVHCVFSVNIVASMNKVPLGGGLSVIESEESEN